MLKSLSRALLASLIVAGALACSDNTLGNTTSTTTPTTTTTDTFNGTLTTNGSVTHQFTAAGAGSIVCTLTTLTATTTGQIVSLSLGTWNGTTCQLILANDQSTQGTVVTGNVSSASNLCVRIADANGSIPGPTPYTLTVSHP